VGMLLSNVEMCSIELDRFPVSVFDLGSTATFVLHMVFVVLSALCRDS